MDKHHKFDTDKLLQMEDEPFAMTICALFIICHEDDNDYKSDRLKAKKSKIEVILGYGWFDYEIDRNDYLNLLAPDFRFVTDIKMKVDKDFLISFNANEKYPPKNEE